MSEESSNRSFKLNDYSDECLKIKDPQALRALGIAVKNNKSDNSEADQFNYKNLENNKDKAPCVPPWAKTMRKAIGFSKFEHREIKTEKAGTGKEISTGKRKVAFIGAHEDVFIFGLKPVQRKKDLFYFRHPSTKSKEVFDKDSDIADATKPSDTDDIIHKLEESDKHGEYKEEIPLDKISMKEGLDKTMADDTDVILEVTEEKDDGTEESHIKSQDGEQKKDLFKEPDDSEENDLKEIMKINEERVSEEISNKDIEKEQKEIEQEGIESAEETEREKEETQGKEEIMREDSDREEKETEDKEEIKRKEELEKEKKETTEEEENEAIETNKRESEEKEEFTDEGSTTQTAKEGRDDHEIDQVITENEKIIQEDNENEKSFDIDKVLEEEIDMDISSIKKESLHEKSYTSSILIKEEQKAEFKTSPSKQSVEEAVYEAEGEEKTGQYLEDSLYHKKSKSSVYDKRKASVTTAESVSLGAVKETKQIDVPTPNEAYLREHLGKHLITALSQVAYKRPADPIHYLAQFLYKQCFNLQARQEHDDETENLMLLREHNQNKQKAPKTLNIVKLRNIKDKSLETNAQLPESKIEGNGIETTATVNEDSELKQGSEVENKE